ncbi:hypothetical protein BDW62DRAFT_189272 [Aspergillus aurantiobrunneus]
MSSIGLGSSDLPHRTDFLALILAENLPLNFVLNLYLLIFSDSRRPLYQDHKKHNFSSHSE